jgi:hypothetical protein
MQPVNTKSLLAFIFNQMERLNAGEIDAQTACAQAKLASQASNVLNYELKRTIVQMRMQQIGTGIEATDITLRNIESLPLTEENFPGMGYPKQINQ